MKMPRIHALTLIALLVTPMVGCGEGNLQPFFPDANTGADSGESDAGTADVDMAEDTGPVGEDIDPRGTVTEDLILITVRPPRTVFEPGLRVTATAELVRAEDDPDESTPNFQWLHEPQDAAEMTGPGQFMLAREGTLVIKACLPGNGDDLYCGRTELIVDAAPPVLELFTPEAGSFHLDPTIQVTGRVVETGHIPHVFIRGQELVVARDGTFAGEITPVFGVNHIVVTATDGVQEEEGTAIVDVMWANFYLPYGGLPDPDDEAGSGPVDPDPDPDPDAIPTIGYDFETAVILALGRDFFDDGVPYRPVPEATEVRTEDLSGLFELVLFELDILDQLPNPVVDSEILTLQLLDFAIESPRVEFMITETGLELFIHLGDIVVDADGLATIGETLLELKGEILASASAVATVRIYKPDKDAELEVELVHFDLSIEEAESHFASEEANALFQVAESALRGAIETLLVDTVMDDFISLIPETVEDLLATIDEALELDDISLAVDPLPPIELSINGSLASVVPRLNERLDVSLDFSIKTPGEALHPSAPGTPMVANVELPPELLSAGKLQVALDLALINGTLYTLWDSGLLELDVTELAPQIAALADRAVISAKLPPVMSVGVDNVMTLTVGQMEMTLDMVGGSEVWGFHLEADGGIENLGSELKVWIGEEPTMTAWLVERIDEPLIPLDSESLENLIMSLLWPALTETIESDLVIPIPEVDVSAISEFAPRLNDLTALIVLDEDLALRGKHLMLRAHLAGRATLAP